MILPKIPILKSSLMICIVFAHMALMYLLYFYTPSKYNPSSYLHLSTPEQITRITFITRPKPKTQQIQNPSLHVVRTPETALANAVNGLQVEFKTRMTNEIQPNTNTNKNLEPLNLSLPESKLDFSPKARDLMERPRNPVEYQATRFNNQWKPSGNAVDSLKWKSKTVNTVLGLFGGNKKICTDEDKKNSTAECVPDGYRPENDTSLPIQ